MDLELLASILTSHLPRFTAHLELLPQQQGETWRQLAELQGRTAPSWVVAAG